MTISSSQGTSGTPSNANGNGSRFYTHRLNNGLQILAEQMPDFESVAVAFHVRTGARDANEKCESAFYVGEWELLRGNRGEAKASLQVAADICPRTFVEYEGAISELRRLGQ